MITCVSGHITEIGGAVMRAKRAATVLLVVAFALAGVCHEARARVGGNNAGVIPPNAKFGGLTYGEWGARWWQAAFATPVVAGDHPVISGGAFGQGHVMFLSAVVGAPATVEVTIPAGTALFLPVINVECSVIEPDPFHGDDETTLLACANGHVDETTGLSAEVDGRAVENLDAYRVESLLFEFGPLPADNLLAFFGVDAPEGTTSLSANAGVYLLLAPLSVGQHVVRVRGTFGGLLSGSIDTTFVITVAPKKR